MDNKITESPSRYDKLERMTVPEILQSINTEDHSIAMAVKRIIPQIERFMKALEPRFLDGGRLFYIGAGTSGRLGILDASEIPPTFGMPHDRVIGLIAGGDGAIRKAVEFAEDNPDLAGQDLSAYGLNEKDTVVGIAASGTTPYVLGGLAYAKKKEALTASITCNFDTPVAKAADYPIEVIVGPEFITGSTRMKSGTAQKMVLNMISTSLMIRIGRVSGNKMVHMQLNNQKLVERGVRFIVEELGIDEADARSLLTKHGSVRKVIEEHQ